MKKWIIIGLVVVLAAVGVTSAIAYSGIQDNGNALETIQTEEGVIVLKVAGMT